jgi:hypothetical protein
MIISVSYLRSALGLCVESQSDDLLNEPEFLAKLGTELWEKLRREFGATDAQKQEFSEYLEKVSDGLQQENGKFLKSGPLNEARGV